MKNLLAIDTSTECATVALAIGDVIIQKEERVLRQHAVCLLPMVERVLVSAGLSIKALDAIIFGRGPGSFTGLRIACSAAKAFAYAHDLPLYPVSTLSSIAYAAYQQMRDPARILTLLDARMSEVYWGFFDVPRNGFDASEHVSAAQDISRDFDTPIVVAGVGLDIYQSQLSEAIQTNIVHSYHVVPQARDMIRLVQAGYIESVSQNAALPVYVRNQVTQGASRG
jgi:tRNA threonylcarbamoyladenosine biosynthesis protein TsaB